MHRGTSKANARDDINDGDFPQRVNARPPDQPIEIPPRINVRRMYIRRMDVECTMRRKGVQAVTKLRGELCRDMERLMMPVGGEREVKAKTRCDEAFERHEEEHERKKKIARRSTDAQETTCNQPLSSSSSSGANRVDNNVQHKQESTDGVHEQDADMNNDDKEKLSPTEEKSHVTVSRNRETEDDDRDSKRQRLSSMATHHFKPQHAGVSKIRDQTVMN